MSTPPVYGATVLFRHQSDQLLGGSQLQRVIEFGAETYPSLIYFESRIQYFAPVKGIPGSGTTKADVQSVADVIGTSIEDALLVPYVTTMAYFQDTTQAGQLLDKMQVFWSTPDESSQGWVELVLAAIDIPTVSAAVDAAVAPFL